MTVDSASAQRQLLEATTSPATSANAKSFEVSDVIGIDQRGTGRSRPNLETPVRYDLPLDKPGSLEEWLPRIRQASRTVAEAFRARGIRLEAYNTRESADDVPDVCRALGYERITLWGRSYGSHLALATLARHSAIVDRLSSSARCAGR